MITHEHGMWLDDGVALSFDDVEAARPHYYSRMLPTTPAASALLLGVCQNNIGFFITEKYPPCHLTLVDHHPMTPDTIQSDAWEFLKTTPLSFDFVAVDLCLGLDLPAFMFDPAFYADLARVAPTAAVNMMDIEAPAPYEDSFSLVRLEQAGPCTLLFLNRLP